MASVDKTNTSKRLPIVFCLDVSPSMGWSNRGETAIDLLNDAVDNFLISLNNNPKAMASAEVAFVPFTDKIERDQVQEFDSIWNTEAPGLNTVEDTGTHISKAVLEGVKIINERREQYKKHKISWYAPLLVLITDGDPDHIEGGKGSPEHRQALETLKKHCGSGVKVSDFIVPLIIGVGDYVNEKSLNDYATVFLDSFFHAKGNVDQVKRALGKAVEMAFEIVVRPAWGNMDAKTHIQNMMNRLLQGLARL